MLLFHPPGIRAEFCTESLHSLCDSGVIAGTCSLGLMWADHGRIESQSGHAVIACLDEEDEGLIVPLDFIDGKVVHEIPGAVKNRHQRIRALG